MHTYISRFHVRSVVVIVVVVALTMTKRKLIRAVVFFWFGLVFDVCWCIERVGRSFSTCVFIFFSFFFGGRREWSFLTFVSLFRRNLSFFCRFLAISFLN